MGPCGGSAGRGCAGCAVGSAARTVGGAASIRIHERVVVSAVRRAGCSVGGNRVSAGAGIASGGRVRRRGGLGRAGHTVRAVAWIRGAGTTEAAVVCPAARVGGVPGEVGGASKIMCPAADVGGPSREVVKSGKVVRPVGRVPGEVAGIRILVRIRHQVATAQTRHLPPGISAQLGHGIGRVHTMVGELRKQVLPELA